jgi:DNA-binding NarL/FixJ family response regulator
MRVLIADDNDGIRRGIIGFLSRDASLEVCGEASDGNEAILKARELAPDLALLDISMAGLNGLEVSRRLRQEMPNIKIIIVSQHDAAHLLPSVRAAGAQGCVDKARLSTDLLSTIKSVNES